MSRLKIAVLFGGVSGEHEVSLVSAYSVLSNLRRDKYDIMCIGITKKGHWMYYPGEYEDIKTGEWENNPDCCTAVISPDALTKGVIVMGGDTYVRRVDVVFPVLHGEGGEDGTIQGLCALAGIPCVGSDMTGSCSCMDKTITHTILDAAGIKTAPYRYITRDALSDIDKACEDIENALSGYPYFVKPSSAGSSVGVSRAANREELKKGIKMAFAYSEKVIVETEIVGKEVECAVLGNGSKLTVSVPGQVNADNGGFYDYDAKYKSGSGGLYVPAHITPEETEEVRDIAARAYRAAGCGGFARVDFFVTENGVYLNEINTIPGFTPISMYPRLMEYSGIPYPELLDRLIELALEKNSEG